MKKFCNLFYFLILLILPLNDQFFFSLFGREKGPVSRAF